MNILRQYSHTPSGNEQEMMNHATSIRSHCLIAWLTDRLPVHSNSYAYARLIGSIDLTFLFFRSRVIRQKLSAWLKTVGILNYRPIDRLTLNELRNKKSEILQNFRTEEKNLYPSNLYVYTFSAASSCLFGVYVYVVCQTQAHILPNIRFSLMYFLYLWRWQSLLFRVRDA